MLVCKTQNSLTQNIRRFFTWQACFLQSERFNSQIMIFGFMHKINNDWFYSWSPKVYGLMTRIKSDLVFFFYYSIFSLFTFFATLEPCCYWRILIWFILVLNWFSFSPSVPSLRQSSLPTTHVSVQACSQVGAQAGSAVRPILKFLEPAQAKNRDKPREKTNPEYLKIILNWSIRAIILSIYVWTSCKK